MLEPSRDLPIIRIDDKGRTEMNDPVVTEHPLTVYVNGQETVTLLCTPDRLEALVAGHLVSEGLVAAREEIAGLGIGYNGNAAIVKLNRAFEITPAFFQKRRVGTGCAAGPVFTSRADAADCRPVTADCRITGADLHAAMRTFEERCELFRRTGGVHAAALWQNGELVEFAEDIGRHNAVDKVFGACFLAGRDPAGGVLLSSGRLSSEIVVKAVRRNVPVVASRSAPMALAVDIAVRMNLTLAGFVRGRRMNIYTGAHRIEVT